MTMAKKKSPTIDRLVTAKFYTNTDMTVRGSTRRSSWAALTKLLHNVIISLTSAGQTLNRQRAVGALRVVSDNMETQEIKKNMWANKVLGNFRRKPITPCMTLDTSIDNFDAGLIIKPVTKERYHFV